MISHAYKQNPIMIKDFHFFSASADVGFAVWDRLLERDLLPQISYTAHLMGSLAGLTMGLLVLKNFDQKLYKQCAWWIAFAVYAGCTAFAVCWNVFYFWPYLLLICYLFIVFLFKSWLTILFKYSFLSKKKKNPERVTLLQLCHIESFSAF